MVSLVHADDLRCYWCVKAHSESSVAAGSIASAAAAHRTGVVPDTIAAALHRTDTAAGVADMHRTDAVVADMHRTDAAVADTNCTDERTKDNAAASRR